MNTYSDAGKRPCHHVLKQGEVGRERFIARKTVNSISPRSPSGVADFSSASQACARTEEAASLVSSPIRDKAEAGWGQRAFNEQEQRANVLIVFDRLGRWLGHVSHS